MPAFFPRATRLALVFAAVAAASGCGSFDRASLSIADAVTPYRVEIIQGNFISKEQVDALRPGLTRQQVREALGTPLVMDLFHADRWDYVFTIRRQGVDPQSRRLTVFFKGDALERFEGDPMPAEAEFVATLDNKRKGAAIPVLEASEAQLKQYAPARPAVEPAAPAPATAVNYPPLEAPTR
ncbi:outer membrane protein assembly factor BamE [Caenimonas koreensis]|uniref:Outer membrane protein assembly factor BamE n=1 Tax=Caenimonas koreensis DSM 17982 TaxID=1121255 RepID=A0A844AY17_9BURK|nr:outer membrane protein assembly factor BamE [Caenimonas koreensis]MRD49255.1 outer membrane protein assembly factor BamE [Caenimonas koreensis DSM 17982]